MADCVGRKIVIPGSAWSPPAEDTPGVIKKYHPPTKRYPSGRFEVSLQEGDSSYAKRWLWEADKFDMMWLVPVTSPTSPGRRRRNSSGKLPTPSPARTGARSRQSPDGTAAAQVQQLSPLTIPSSAQPLANGPSSAAAGAAEQPVSPTPAKRGRGRPRKSVSFYGVPPSPISPSLQQPLASPTAAGAANNTNNGAFAVVDATGGPSAAGNASNEGLVDTCGPNAELTAEERAEVRKALLNLVLLASMALPAIFFGRFVRNVCPAVQLPPASPAVAQGGWRGAVAAVQEFLLGSFPLQAPSPQDFTQFSSLPPLAYVAAAVRAWTSPQRWCALAMRSPVAAVNVVFALNVDVLFWAIAMLQGSSWLIDPYWTFIPPLIGAFYWSHPLAVALPARCFVAMVLLLVWAVRLTHSYFRREEWQVGAREDWRYADMRAAAPRTWWLRSIFAVYIAQHAMLVGITLPLAAIHAHADAWSWLDTLATLMAVTGLTIAYYADNQLYEYTEYCRRRMAIYWPNPRVVLDTGLWRYSRHPNYFGELLWWWALALFAIRLGEGWMAVGAAFNTLCMVGVTMLTEARMLAKPERARAYRAYMAKTSVWVPLPPGRLRLRMVDEVVQHDD